MYYSLQRLIFDHLPIAAVIFDHFVCVHGGLPEYDGRNFLEALSNLKKPIDSNDPLIFQSLWNDPARNSNLQYFGDSPRGNGIRIFGQNSVDNFCENNNYLMIIRGHEFCQDGFSLSLENRVLTVFSSANYCGGGNLGGILSLSLEEVEVEGKKVKYPAFIFAQFDSNHDSRCSECIDAIDDVFESKNLDINALMGPVNSNS